MMMAPLRVKAFTKDVPAPYGYVGRDQIHIQQLQVQTWAGWITIDEEVVPAAAKIAQACTGDSGWVSKFAKFGSFSRDGIIKQEGAS
jgi:hypothetical protein